MDASAAGLDGPRIDIKDDSNMIRAAALALAASLMSSMGLAATIKMDVHLKYSNSTGKTIEQMAQVTLPSDPQQWLTFIPPTKKIALIGRIRKQTADAAQVELRLLNVDAPKNAKVLNPSIIIPFGEEARLEIIEKSQHLTLSLLATKTQTLAHQ